jgi:hypothetical protein
MRRWLYHRRAARFELFKGGLNRQKAFEARSMPFLAL